MRRFLFYRKGGGAVGPLKPSTELAQELNRYGNLNLSAKGMKQMMNRWRYGLQELGLTFQNRRSNGQRFVEVSFCPPEAVTQGTKERVP